MIPNVTFARALSEGIHSVCARQDRLVASVQDEIGQALHCTGANVERWRKGQPPREHERIAFLAQYCVRNGHVGADWARRFLASARHPERDEVLRALFPNEPSVEATTSRRNNLPRRDADMLGRAADIEQVLSDLASRYPLVSIEGLGGVGKTTLAKEVAYRALEPLSDRSGQFDAAVWVSAKSRPEQRLWLVEVLRTILRVLAGEQPTDISHEDRVAQVSQLLKTHRTLLVIDNFETVDDPDLVTWMEYVPEPSKVLVTGRYGQLRGVKAVHLRGLEDQPALTLIRRHANALGLRQLEMAPDDVLLPLVRVTEGNPLALAMSVGFVKRRGLTLDRIVDDLHSAGQNTEGLFSELFARAWTSLSSDARSLLMGIAMFPDSVQREPLAVASDLRGYRLDSAVAHLREMLLIESSAELEQSQQRFSIHSLTKSYALARTDDDWRARATARLNEFFHEARVSDLRLPEIEAKWQQRWETDELNVVSEGSDRPKWYALAMITYPSAHHLHIGHWYSYAPADAHARFMRMRGYNVLFPFGFDSFGLPSENHALLSGIHPQVSTMQNIDRMRQQVRAMGGSFDWTREIVCSDPSYYRWTQWIFLLMWTRGLAYKMMAPANWCAGCNRTLANEQVLDGRCERCGTEVTRSELEQWYFRVGAYADELLDFSKVEWPEKVIQMQRNWIGRTEGVELTLEAEDGSPIPVFTTRADLVYGATFVVLAPEHPLVDKLCAPARREEVQAYAERARNTSEIERASAQRDVTGVSIGAHAINPFNGERLPVWVADYILPTYGSGAALGVPGHDQRDFDFAKEFDLPTVTVVTPPGWQGGAMDYAYTGPGMMVNSGPFDGTPSREAIEKIIAFGEARGFAKPAVHYRLRDWLISRQRYWGAPIPIVYCPIHAEQSVPEDELPVVLPEDVEFASTGESPLRRHAGFLNARCPTCGGPATRDTDTMDTFVDSSWYFLRHVSPNDDQGPWDRGAAKHWLPVDQYMGGAEHAILHLLYARFMVKALRDAGVLAIDEPFTRLFSQGLITAGGAKLRKSTSQAIVPDEYVSRFGADVLRAYLMFLGPWEQGGEWTDNGVTGLLRFARPIWAMVQESGVRLDEPVGPFADGWPSSELRQLTHRTIASVTQSFDRFRFNLAVAALMSYVRELAQLAGDVRDTAAWREAVRTLLLLVAPVMPHLAEECWATLGGAYSIHAQRWPEANESLVAVNSVVVVVQVDGKIRDRLSLPVDADQETVLAQATASRRVTRLLEGRRVAQTIYVPGRVLNFVTAE
ncbi:MAG: leucine--tRNA ligase [Chloroflexi bacterium]|nr:leucine--tRNA ligase [Chloroflexota bacterium]